MGSWGDALGVRFCGEYWGVEAEGEICLGYASLGRHVGL